MSDSTGGWGGRRSNWTPLADSSGPRREVDGLHEAVTEIREHFERHAPRLRYEGLAGRGAAGFVFRLVESGGRGPRARVRRLALKRAASVFHEEWLQTEIEWLKTLANGEHIVRMLAFRNDAREDEPPNKKRYERIRRWWRGMRRSPLESSLKGLSGPVYIMEHLENGTLYKFYKGIEHENYRVPNKILWSFLLCLIRSCVAMAYPLENMEAEGTQLEDTRPGPPYTLCHTDMHMANAMIGDLGNFPEHDIVPGLKLIDFGFAEAMYMGEVYNLYGACLLVIRLITRAHVVQDELRDFADPRQVPLSVEMLGTWHAKYPRLDPALTDLLARAVAFDHEQRPSLDEMLAAAGAGAARPGHGFGHAPESDAYVRTFLQNMLYDARPPVHLPPGRGFPGYMYNDPYHVVSSGVGGAAQG